MGIKKWFEVFGVSAIPITEKDFKGKYIGVDASYDIFRASLGMKSVHALTDKSGNPTIFLNTLLSNVAKYKRLKVSGLLYIFDNPKPTLMKLAEYKKRKDAKRKADIKHKECDTKDKDALGKRCFRINDSIIADVKKMLSLLGVSWITAPHGYEAEHLGAELTRLGIIDSLITSDSDTILFGGTSFIRRIPNKKNKYEEYRLSEVLVDFDINREQLVHLGVVMGSDFNKKTPGIGVKTILTKGLNVKLTDEQKTAMQYFLTPCPFVKEDIVKNTTSEKRIEDLKTWLVNDKNFNHARITKLLSKF